MSSPIQLRPSAKLLTLWRIYGMAILIAVILFGAAIVYFISLTAIIPLSVILTSLTVYILSYLPALLDCRSYTRSRGILEIRKGCIFKKTTVVPRSQLRYISVRRRPLERTLGLSTLVFHTTGGSVALSGLEQDDAERMKEYFSRRYEG